MVTARMYYVGMRSFRSLDATLFTNIPGYEIGGLLSVVGPGFLVLAPSEGPLFCTVDWLLFFSHNIFVRVRTAPKEVLLNARVSLPLE
jgi:hypothetical protein